MLGQVLSANPGSASDFLPNVFPLIAIQLPYSRGRAVMMIDVSNPEAGSISISTEVASGFLMPSLPSTVESGGFFESSAVSRFYPYFIQFNLYPALVRS